MKPEQFIREFGVEKAREVVDGAPSNAESFQDGYYFRTKPQFEFHNGIHEAWNLTDNDGEYFKKRGFEPVNINDLKRLLESVYFVHEHYTVERAKIYADSPYTAPEVKQALERAIADYESIYGGGENA
ncbi:hypothetical protein [Acinetobacter pittii]|uniref:hypothetical protein n=1 Tax=Acinetobacter pittii TaxID=48296 RepID=UPI00301C9898